MQDIIYFELNNNFPHIDYPNKQPYLTWMADRILTLADPDFAKTHNLAILACQIGMCSINFCVTAPRTFIETYCPTLLAEDSRFLRNTKFSNKVYGRFNHEFLPYIPDYIGSVWWLPTNYGNSPEWIMKRYEENQKQLLSPIKNHNLYDFIKNIVGKNLYYYFSEDINLQDLWEDYPSKDMTYEDFAKEITALEQRILKNGKPRYPQDLVKATKLRKDIYYALL